MHTQVRYWVHLSQVRVTLFGGLLTQTIQVRSYRLGEHKYCYNAVEVAGMAHNKITYCTYPLGVFIVVRDNTVGLNPTGKG
jgi:hypothetical protein